MNTLTAPMLMARRHREQAVSASPVRQLAGAAVQRSRQRPESPVSIWTPLHRPARPSTAAPKYDEHPSAFVVGIGIGIEIDSDPDPDSDGPKAAHDLSAIYVTQRSGAKPASKTERVVPVAIFLRPGERRESLTLGGDRCDFLTFRYLACALKHLNWNDWRDSDNIVARLNLPNMAHRPDERVDVYALALRGLMQLEPDPERQVKYLDFVEIYSHLNEDERARYAHDYPEEASTVQSYSERIREEGEQAGQKIGQQMGIQIGEANMLIYQLEKKFGEIPDALRRRIQQADPDTLLRWSGRILTEENIDSVLQ